MTDNKVDVANLLKDKVLPKISMKIFRKMIVNMSPSDIMRIPLESLPDEMPVSLVNEVPNDIKPAIEHLMMERNSVALKTRNVISGELGKTALAAIDLSKQVGDKANIRTLTFKIAEIDEMVERMADNPSLENDQLLSKFIANTNKMLPDLLTEQTQTTNGINALLHESELPENLQDTVDIARDKLLKQQRSIDNLISKYYAERVNITQEIMQRRIETLEATEADLLFSHREIEKYRTDLLKAKKRASRPFGKKKYTSAIEELKTRITHLNSKMLTSQIPIDSNELTLWLDSIVDASLHKTAKQRVAMKIHLARKDLLLILHAYCEQQEGTAMQIAKNPFLQVEPEKIIGFAMKSEQFILNYFQEKKAEVTSQISMAASMKMEALLTIEKEILKELKDNRSLR